MEEDRRLIEEERRSRSIRLLKYISSGRDCGPTQEIGNSSRKNFPVSPLIEIGIVINIPFSSGLQQGVS
jgi:hypothetical protein